MARLIQPLRTPGSWTSCVPAPTKIWGSRASIITDPPDRDSLKSVLGLGKTPAQVAGIAAEIVRRGSTLLVTRASADAFEAIRDKVPGATFYADAAIVSYGQQDVTPGKV